MRAGSPWASGRGCLVRLHLGSQLSAPHFSLLHYLAYARKAARNLEITCVEVFRSGLRVGW
jgi:hypothetical protein